MYLEVKLIKVATMKEIRKVNQSLGDPVGEFVSPTFDIHIRWRE